MSSISSQPTSASQSLKLLGMEVCKLKEEKESLHKRAAELEAKLRSEVSVPTDAVIGAKTPVALQQGLQELIDSVKDTLECTDCKSTLESAVVYACSFRFARLFSDLRAYF
jgi:FtsZ-binding cell division protein ZapB